METLNGSNKIVCQSYQKGFSKMRDDHEVIYSNPDFIMKPPDHEKNAVRIIMEKYDSLKCLNNQMEGLELRNSKDSICKASLEDISRHGSVTTTTEEEENNSSNLQIAEELSEQDVAQIEVFFRSHKTFVYVCRCLVNLYFTTLDNNDSPGDWELARTGVPVLLLDKGETRARNKRMLQIVLAEKGSGFVLWKDIIDNLSNYRAQDGTFHTLYLSSDHRRMAGLSYDKVESAELFLSQVEQLTSDPLNISLSVPKQKKKKTKSVKKKEKVKQPRKCDISQPCCFEHVTNVALDDKKRLYSMATLVPTGETV